MSESRIRRIAFKVLPVVVVTITALVFVGAIYRWYNFSVWQSAEEPFGRRYNAFRAKYGIPLVEDGWYTEETSIKMQRLPFYRNATVDNPWVYQVWKNYDETPIINGQAFHKSKEIYRRLGRIDHESDIYYRRENDSVEVLLEVKFKYFKEPDSVWSAFLVVTTEVDGDFKVRQQDIKISQADSILAVWGLSRIRAVH